MMQNLVVALMVSAAAIYVGQRYSPKWLTRKVSAWLAAALAMIGWRGAAEVLSRESPAGTSCGNGCGRCGACAPEAASDSDKPVSTHSAVTFHRR